VNTLLYKVICSDYFFFLMNPACNQLPLNLTANVQCRHRERVGVCAPHWSPGWLGGGGRPSLRHPTSFAMLFEQLECKQLVLNAAELLKHLEQKASKAINQERPWFSSQLQTRALPAQEERCRVFQWQRKLLLYSDPIPASLGLSVCLSVCLFFNELQKKQALARDHG